MAIAKGFEKAIKEIRKDLNKWSARIVQSNFYVTEKNANF